MKNRKRPSNFLRAVRKFFLSAFVVVTFIAYALENHSVTTRAQNNQVASNGDSTPQTATPHAHSDNSAAQAQGVQIAHGDPVTSPVATPTQTPSAAPTNPPPQVTNPSPQTVQNGQYQNGTYTGPEVDIYYGLVQVQAVVQDGKITDVKFLEYPADRRTSQRINSYAVPTLQQEAIQAQSANVDIITGATLTSEGFQMSLQAALNQAKGVS